LTINNSWALESLASWLPRAMLQEFLNSGGYFQSEEFQL